MKRHILSYRLVYLNKHLDKRHKIQDIRYLEDSKFFTLWSLISNLQWKCGVCISWCLSVTDLSEDAREHRLRLFLIYILVEHELKKIICNYINSVNGCYNVPS
jgi:hypothetical protein